MSATPVEGLPDNGLTQTLTASSDEFINGISGSAPPVRPATPKEPSSSNLPVQQTTPALPAPPTFGHGEAREYIAIFLSARRDGHITPKLQITDDFNILFRLRERMRDDVQASHDPEGDGQRVAGLLVMCTKAEKDELLPALVDSHWQMLSDRHSSPLGGTLSEYDKLVKCVAAAYGRTDFSESGPRRTPKMIAQLLDNINDGSSIGLSNVTNLAASQSPMYNDQDANLMPPTPVTPSQLHMRDEYSQMCGVPMPVQYPVGYGYDKNSYMGALYTTNHTRFHPQTNNGNGTNIVPNGTHLIVTSNENRQIYQRGHRQRGYRQRGIHQKGNSQRGNFQRRNPLRNPILNPIAEAFVPQASLFGQIGQELGSTFALPEPSFQRLDPLTPPSDVDSPLIQTNPLFPNPAPAAPVQTNPFLLSFVPAPVQTMALSPPLVPIDLHQQQQTPLSNVQREGTANNSPVLLDRAGDSAEQRHYGPRDVELEGPTVEPLQQTDAGMHEKIHQLPSFCSSENEDAPPSEDIRQPQVEHKAKDKDDVSSNDTFLADVKTAVSFQVDEAPMLEEQLSSETLIETAVSVAASNAPEAEETPSSEIAETVIIDALRSEDDPSSEIVETAANIPSATISIAVDSTQRVDDDSSSEIVEQVASIVVDERSTPRDDQLFEITETVFNVSSTASSTPVDGTPEGENYQSPDVVETLVNVPADVIPRTKDGRPLEIDKVSGSIQKNEAPTPKDDQTWEIVETSATVPSRANNVPLDNPPIAQEDRSSGQEATSSNIKNVTKSTRKVKGKAAWKSMNRWW